ncbi:Hypothetical predicted protein [Mytilus galloprovincialis]|uniref:Protein arginine N-methyltransferase domain-containing protein n=1 Tax=Mytilus galloprovincialis TaxID=29158 RepID=A0A8B6DEB2_MYTGA|nr:Hypothetical predicted protein [Mytilus galloprovincialis]
MDECDQKYFGSYSKLNIHEVMLKDEVRTGTYRNAILQNTNLFRDKVVLDVGCGTVITLIKCKVEDATLPDGIDKVDIIISETMGYCLLFESSIHSILFARDKWLKKEGGLIFPDKFWLYLTAFEDKRFRDKISYWDNVQGYDMSSIIRHQDFDSMYVDIIDASKVVSNSSLIKGFEMDECDIKYFGSYSNLNIHEVMLRDEVRTGTYRNAILQNAHLFRNKTVLDVGCGTGILSMFAAEAGASKVIGVEDAKLPDGIDKVDIIISEWMGYCLLFETFINSILFARDKWLKKEGGLIFPDKFWLYLTAFEDKRFIKDKESFWDNIQGYDMSSIIQHQDFDRMYVDIIDASKVVSNSSLIKEINLYTVKEKDLSFEAPYHIQIKKTGVIDGFLTYFDTGFSHCVRKTAFSTAPEAKTIHWKQTVIPFWNTRFQSQ